MMQGYVMWQLMEDKLEECVLDILFLIHLDDKNLVLISDIFILSAKFPNLYYYR